MEEETCPTAAGQDGQGDAFVDSTRLLSWDPAGYLRFNVMLQECDAELICKCTY
jgi:hypothetical protein